jgi:sugar phosphate permease
LPPILPVLTQYFNVSHGEIGALASVSFISYAIILLPAGFLGDALGSKKVVALGAMVSVISNIVFSQVSSFSTALVIQFFNGLGQGMAWGPLTRLISDRYSKKRMRLVMSILLVPPNVGPVLAYATSSYLATEYDWRAAFLYPSFVLLISTCLFWLLIKNKPFHILRGENRRMPVKERICLIFYNRNLWFIALAYSCYMCISRSLLVWLPTYFSEEFHLSPFFASFFGGLVVFNGIIPMFVGSYLGDVKLKGRNRLVIASSFALAIPVLWMLPQISDVTQVLMLYSMIFAFLGLGGSLYYAYCPIFLPREIVGTATGFIDSLAYIVSFLGTLSTGAILDAGSYDSVFTLLIIMAGAGIIFSLLIKES